VKAFRALMRLKNILTCFVDFDFADLAMSEQEFEDYKSKYLDLYDKVKSDTQKEKDSILNDVDFELELIQRDEINVAYILRLLANLKAAKPADQEKQKREIQKILATEVKLRSKRELIEKFIAENLPHVESAEAVPQSFDAFVAVEKQKALNVLSEQEKLQPEGLQKVISDYLFTERTPLPDEIINILEVKPKLLERKSIVERVKAKILDFVETFFNDMPG
jgi:type I restriction enzyme R subunit